MVDRWSGSIEAGVSLVPPEELSFPRTMTDIEFDTWMVSGSAVMKVTATCTIRSSIKHTGYKIEHLHFLE